jgi:hypothetical protein
MTFFIRVMLKHLNANLGRIGGRAGLAALLLGTACSCQRKELAAQVDAAKAALQEQQMQLERLRSEQGRSGATEVLPASQNWHLQELQKRLTEGRGLEAELAVEKAELERALKNLESVRSDYLKNHGGAKS